MAVSLLNNIVLLVDNYEVFDVKNEKGITALDCAIATNDMDLIKVLYKRNMELKKNLIEGNINVAHFQYALLNEKITAEGLKNIIFKTVNTSEDNKIEVLKKILNDNHAIHRCSLLHMASVLDNSTIVEDLLESNNLTSDSIDLKVKDEDGRTPLIYAIWAENKDMVSKLRNKDESIIMAKDNYGLLPIHYAIHKKDKDMVGTVLPEKDDIVSIRDDAASNRTLLHCAISSGDLDIFNIIYSRLEDRVNEIINIKDTEKGQTVLHYAAITRNIDALEFLLNDDRLSLDLGLRDKLGLRAVDYLLMGKIDTNNKTKNVIRTMINKIDDSNELRNLLYTACCNMVEPNIAIKIVLDSLRYREEGKLKTESERLLKSLQPTKVNDEQETALDKIL